MGWIPDCGLWFFLLWIRIVIISVGSGSKLWFKKKNMDPDYEFLNLWFRIEIFKIFDSGLWFFKSMDPIRIVILKNPQHWRQSNENCREVWKYKWARAEPDPSFVNFRFGSNLYLIFLRASKERGQGKKKKHTRFEEKSYSWAENFKTFTPKSTLKVRIKFVFYSINQLIN